MLSQQNARTLPVAARGKRLPSTRKPAANTGDASDGSRRRTVKPGVPEDEERIEAELDRVVGRGDK